MSYTHYNGSILAYQNKRKLDVQDRKVEGRHSVLDLYFGKYMAKQMRYMLNVHPCIMKEIDIRILTNNLHTSTNFYK